jgi:predicted SAM-dependent methyltransferase
MSSPPKHGEVGSPQVPAEHYFRPTYDSKGRFTSYWCQIDELRSLADGEILEVGPGNQFVANYLRDRCYAVTTMDIDPDLDVDVVGSITDIPCEDDAFAVAACFEVLEHMPYKQALAGLRELRRVARDYVVISVPDYEHAIWGRVRLPIVGQVEWFFSFERPFPFESPHIDDQHFWEIGMEGYPTSRIRADLEALGFRITRTYRLMEQDNHRFFVLDNRGSETGQNDH